MQQLVLPDKVTWFVDLQKRDSELLPKSLYKRVTRKNYLEGIDFEVVSSKRISDLFLPEYERLILGRKDFRLDPLITRKKMYEMSENREYELLWFRDLISNNFLGGIVVHILPNEIRVAYRCFDHLRTKSLRIPEADYYAEMLLHEYARRKKIYSLCHGNDHHPITQMGLSIPWQESPCLLRLERNACT